MRRQIKGRHPTNRQERIILRSLPENFILTMNQIGKDIPTFAYACAVADLIVRSGVTYDSVVIVYNGSVSWDL